jgi:hypothetical protein
MVADLFTGWLVFLLLVALTVLSQKAVDFAIKGEPIAGRHLQGPYLVAWIFEIALFVLYHVLKVREFVKPHLPPAYRDSFSHSDVTWVSFAKSATTTFFASFTKLFRRRRPKLVRNVEATILVGEENWAMLVKMMRTAKTDAEIRKWLRSQGFEDGWIDRMLGQ